MASFRCFDGSIIQQVTESYGYSLPYCGKIMEYSAWLGGENLMGLFYPQFSDSLLGGCRRIGIVAR